MIGPAGDRLGRVAAAGGDLQAGSKGAWGARVDLVPFAVRETGTDARPSREFQAAGRGQAVVQRDRRQSALLQREEKGEPSGAVGQLESDPLPAPEAVELRGQFKCSLRQVIGGPLAARVRLDDDDPPAAAPRGFHPRRPQVARFLHAPGLCRTARAKTRGSIFRPDASPQCELTCFIVSA
jgi:hypothetical protein